MNAVAATAVPLTTMCLASATPSRPRPAACMPALSLVAVCPSLPQRQRLLCARASGWLLGDEWEPSLAWPGTLPVAGATCPPVCLNAREGSHADPSVEIMVGLRACARLGLHPAAMARGKFPAAETPIVAP